jgi:NAD(P)-dependent dehydrogenase (short-subunit alcohol dehydrogenase family)
MLNGKVAVVTGGAGGVGRAVTEAFVREGASVVVADVGADLDGTGRSRQPLDEAVAALQGHAGSAHPSLTDVSDREQAAELIEGCVAKFGRLDILVNCAAILRHGSIHDTEASAWMQVLQVNLSGTFNTTALAAKHWIETGAGGRLINFGSDAGLIGVANEVAYSVSKAGVINLTLCCAETLKPHRVTCNIVHPQAATRLTASIPREELPDAERWETNEFAPEHVAPAVVYLASDQGCWITGCVLAAFGYEAHLYRLAERQRSIYSPGPWDSAVLGRRMREAFGQLVDKN